MYLEKELENGADIGWEVGIGIGVAVVFIGYLLYKRSSKTKAAAELENSGEIEKSIDSFIKDIILDYYHEYRINYLGVRYNIKDLATENTYVFKTKRIGSLSNIVDYSQVPAGEKYLHNLIFKKYNTEVSEDEQLEFITEISRIEGKIQAVESVKSEMPDEDYRRLIGELQEDKMHYKRKYASAVI